MYSSTSVTVSTGVAGTTLTWNQTGDTLELQVSGAGAEYVGLADLSDTNAWPDLDSANSAIIDGGAVVTLDLVAVKELTVFELVPIAALENRVFRPCSEIGNCFPPRPPEPDPWNGLRSVHLHK
ncbi:MAG: hypothetical protein KDD47_04740 [Acidobacteria bacterium]|nr:hypothetical protein [Acidobacteriota bacterium]